MPSKPQPFRLPQRFDSPTLAKLAIAGEPTVIVRAVGVGSTAPFEYSDRNGRQAIFRYDQKYDAHVLKVPASIWNANKGFMAHELMDQRRLPHPLVVTVEVPATNAAGITYAEAQDAADLAMYKASPILALIERMKADPEYAWGWHCNIAMSAHDSGAGPHSACNRGAALFLSLLSDGAVDTTTHPAYAQTQAPANRLTQHAIQELETLTRVAGEELTITPFIPAVVALVQAFAESGQSGGSAPLTAACITQTLEKLLAYKPLTRLTGEESEWNDVGELMGEPMWQNRRDSRVFKHLDGTVTFNNALIWDEEDGERIAGCVAGFTSSQPITLPCIPSTRYVKVRRLPTEDPDDWQYEIADKEEEAELRSLYLSSQGELDSDEDADANIMARLVDEYQSAQTTDSFKLWFEKRKTARMKQEILSKSQDKSSGPYPATTFEQPKEGTVYQIDLAAPDSPETISPEMDVPGTSEVSSDVVVGQDAEQPGASASETLSSPKEGFISPDGGTDMSGNATAPLYSRAWDMLESPMRLKELAAVLETDPDTLKAALQDPLSAVELGHAGWVKRREPQA